MSEHNHGQGGVWSRRALRIAVVLCGISLLAIVGLVIAHETQAGRRADQAKNDAQGKARQLADLVASHLNQIKPVVEELARQLSSGQLTGEPLQQRLRAIYEEHHADWRLLEVGVAYEPEHNPLSPGEVSAPHFGLVSSGEIRAFDVSDSYDYRTYDWYRETKENGAHWIDPYFGKATGRWTAGYAAPFYRAPDSTVVAGVVRINFDLDKTRQMIRGLGSGFLDEEQVLTAGYIFVVSKRNKVITHPIKHYWGQDIFVLGQTDGTLRAIAAELDGDAEGAGGVIRDPITGESYWVLTEDIAATDWKGVVVINKRHTQNPARTARCYQRSITAAVVVFLCSISFLLLRVHRGSTASLWRFSFVSSLLFLAGTIVTWIFAVTGESPSNHNGVEVVDAATAEAMVARHLQLSSLDADQVVRLPTGVFVQSLTFTGANNVHLTGYIWQRKIANPEQGRGQDVYGFILPEAEDLDRQPAYETDEVIGWYFETTLRQQFDYSRYPFDREDVWIRFWPESMNPNVVLIPDFASYREKKIDGIPGVEQDFVLQGWVIKNSYFSFRKNSYNVDFGRTGFNAQRSLELHFSVGLVRDFVSPFVSDMIPISVIAFLAFAVLMSATRHEESIDLYGFSTASVLGYCAALFFVLIVAHVNLRTTLASQGVIYMEYYYFVMYLVILGVSTDALLFASPRNYPLIHYQDNVIVKQAYWPLLNGVMFAVTLYVFR